ncbi:unnamed protein product [Victoria cruziana]
MIRQFQLLRSFYIYSLSH